MKKLRSFSSFKSEVRIYLKEKCLDVYVKGKIYESQPMISFSERHGGPLHYDLSVIRIIFGKNNDVKIEKEDFPNEKLEVFNGSYKITGAFPYFVYGDIILHDGRKFKFQTVRRAMNYIFIENPPMWSKSFLVKISN